jgi:hypothetical protein
MYTIDWAGLLSRPARRAASAQPPIDDGAGVALASPLSRKQVSRTVWYLGLTSFFTDVSSEMVASVLPLYLFMHLRMNPLTFGLMDGLYQGFSAIARLGGGLAADWRGKHKAVASIGYGLSAFCRLGLLFAGDSRGLLAATIMLDRTGKGIRTAPRDALISISTPRADLGSAFGVHRALDAAGAMLGPLAAFALLAFLPGAFDVVFVVSFSIAMIGCGVILFLVDSPTPPAAGPGPVFTWSAAIGLLSLPAFRRLALAGGILALATVSDSFVFLTLQRQLGFSAAYFPLLYVGVAACHSALALPAGRIADRWGRWRIFIVGHFLLLLVYAVMVAPLAGALQLVIALALFGAYYAATDGVLTAMASATLPSRLSASGLALLASITSIGRLLASVFFGAIWQWTSLATAIVVFAAGLLIAILAARIVLSRSTDLFSNAAFSGD